VLADEDRHVLFATIAAMTEHVWEQLTTQPWGAVKRTVWNHNVVAYTAVTLAGLTVPDHPLAEEWVANGFDRTRRFLEEGVTPAGMTWEGLGYCGLVFKHLGMVLAAIDNLGWRDRYFPAGGSLEQRLARVPEWYAHSVFPRGCYLQNYNDSQWDPHSALWGFLLTFAPYRPELCAAIWERLVGTTGLGTFGYHGRRSSLAEAMLFFPDVDLDLRRIAEIDDVFCCPDVGYLAARDKGDAEATVFTFNAGPFLGGIHDQADNNSFTIIGRGAPMVIDSGAANRADETSPSSSLGHNSVFIDGRGEHVAGQGKGVDAEITAVAHDDLFVAVTGDATRSYSARNYNTVRWAYRHAVFVKLPVPYIVTFDDIRKDGDAHDFEQLLHVPRGERTVSSEGNASLTILDTSGGVAGRALFLSPRSIAVASDTFRSEETPFEEHELWRVATTAENPRFVTLFLVGDASEPRRHRVTASRFRNQLRVELVWDGIVDRFTFPLASALRRAQERPGPPTFHRKPVNRGAAGADRA
jgi:hypothetical protein